MPDFDKTIRSIYIIRYIPEGRDYVGLTSHDPQDRIKAHLAGRGGSQVLADFVEKFPAADFEPRVVYETDSFRLANHLEGHLIGYLPRTFNILSGGTDAYFLEREDIERYAPQDSGGLTPSWEDIDKEISKEVGHRNAEILLWQQKKANREFRKHLQKSLQDLEAKEAQIQLEIAFLRERLSIPDEVISSPRKWLKTVEAEQNKRFYLEEQRGLDK